VVQQNINQVLEPSFGGKKKKIHYLLQFKIDKLYLNIDFHFLLKNRIRRFPGDSENTISAEIELTPSVSGNKIWSRPPISMQFTVPMFTASGFHVRFLKVVEPKLQYQTIKWVRYVTKAGQYQHRI
jgi:hypothetical protein